MLSEFLPHLDSWNTRRRDIASQYSRFIEHPAIILPSAGGEDYVAHLYVVRSVERDRLRRHLRKLDIATDVHYSDPRPSSAFFWEPFFRCSLTKYGTTCARSPIAAALLPGDGSGGL